MKFIVESGNGRVIFKDFNRMSEDFSKVFRFMLSLQAREMIQGKVTYKIKVEG